MQLVWKMLRSLILLVTWAEGMGLIAVSNINFLLCFMMPVECI